MIHFKGDTYETGFNINSSTTSHEQHWLFKNGQPIHPLSDGESEHPENTILKFLMGREPMDMAAEYQEMDKFLYYDRYFYANHYLGAVRRRETVEIINATTLEIVGYMSIDNFNDPISRCKWMENFLQHEKERAGRNVGNYKPDDGTEKSGCAPLLGWALAALLFILALIQFLSK